MWVVLRREPLLGERSIYLVFLVAGLVDVWDELKSEPLRDERFISFCWSPGQSGVLFGFR